MRIQWALLCIVATSLAGFSQDKSFDLNRYKFPDYKRHELELNFNSSGQGYSQYFEYHRPGNGQVVKYDNSDFQSNSNASLGYIYEKYTRRHINLLSCSLSGQYEYSKSTHSEDKTIESNPHGSINFSGSSRYYLTRDKLFVEGLGNTWFEYSDRKNTHEVVGQNPLIARNKSNFLNLSAGVGIGIGRIEKVSDFWQAYYILEKLNGQKSLVRELQEKDIFEFATLASQLKNERFFDSRIRKIAELKALDSLLHSQGLIDNGDIGYFTTLNDYWSYGNFLDRRSGGELKVQVMPEYISHYWKTDESPSTTSSETNLVSKIQFDHIKQLNLYWERNFHIGASNSTLLETDRELPDDYPSNLISTEVQAGIGFFPDSRTSLRLSGGYSGSEYARYDININGIDKKWSNGVMLHLDTNYYFSPQLQFIASVNGTFQFSEFEAMENKSMNYQVGLRYAIF